MVSGTGFSSRVGSLLQSLRLFRFADHSSDSDASGYASPRTVRVPDQRDKLPIVNQPDSPSSNGRTIASSTGEFGTQYNETERPVRTLPTWVRTCEDEGEDEDSTSQLLPKVPASVQIAQHNSSPASKSRYSKHERRRHDSLREREPPTPRSHVTEGALRWRAFVDASTYPTLPNENHQLVDAQWLTENGPNYDEPWAGGLDNQDPEKGVRPFGSKSKRQAWWLRTQRSVLRNPVVPLIVRLVVWVFSLIALILGGSLYRQRDTTQMSHSTSPEMAIVVDTVALIYLIYITLDEYTGKPLGLRSAKSKMRLIFLDLFFIVFDSANLSLAMEALSDDSSLCKQSGQGQSLARSTCHLQQALASVLLVALIAWLTAFSISVLRLVERVTQK